MSWIGGAKEKRFLGSTLQRRAVKWLAENGPRELELLLRAIVFQPSAPILLADNDRHYREASVGASKLLGLPREKIIGRSLDDFVVPNFRPVIPERWSAFLEKGEQEGMLQLVGPDGGVRDIEYSAKGSVLPVRHLLVLRDKIVKTPRGSAEADKDPAKSGTGPERLASRPETGGDPAATSSVVPIGALKSVPAWVQDYALFLLDVQGEIVAWYAGAERIYGYKSGEVVGQPVSLLYPDEDAVRRLSEELKRTAVEGHAGTEGWHAKKSGSRFWANVITMALKDENGNLQGYARVVRDFTDRHERDEKLRRSRAHAAVRCLRHRLSPASSPASLTEFQKPTTRFLNLSDTAARICRQAGCAGPI